MWKTGFSTILVDGVYNLIDKHKKRFTVIIWLCFWLYIILLIYFLFFSERYGRSNVNGYRYNLIPFSEIGRYVSRRGVFGTELFSLNIIGNIVAFIPFGFCMPLLSKAYRNFWIIVLNGFCITACIETVQLIFKVGSFDIDDIILNVAGVIIGYVFYKAVMFLRR